MTWFVLVAFMVGVCVGSTIGIIWQRRRNPQTWLERKAAPVVAPREPEPGEAWPTVQQVFYRRTNEPGSTSKME